MVKRVLLNPPHAGEHREFAKSHYFPPRSHMLRANPAQTPCIKKLKHALCPSYCLAVLHRCSLGADTKLAKEKTGSSKC